MLENQSEAAKLEGVCHTDSECEQMYAQIDPALKLAALEFIRSKIPLADAEKIRTLIQQYGNRDWLWHLYDAEIAALSDREKEYSAAVYSSHFGFGMGVRNILRQHGFGEKELDVHNLDDIYIPLVAEAVLSAK